MKKKSLTFRCWAGSLVSAHIQTIFRTSLMFSKARWCHVAKPNTTALLCGIRWTEKTTIKFTVFCMTKNNFRALSKPNNKPWEVGFRGFICSSITRYQWLNIWSFYICMLLSHIWNVFVINVVSVFSPQRLSHVSWCVRSSWASGGPASVFPATTTRTRGRGSRSISGDEGAKEKRPLPAKPAASEALQDNSQVNKIVLTFMWRLSDSEPDKDGHEVLQTVLGWHTCRQPI